MADRVGVSGQLSAFIPTRAEALPVSLVLMKIYFARLVVSSELLRL